LLPALEQLTISIERRASELADVVTTGRTHLMDALPVTLGQELSGWAAQIRQGIERINGTLLRVQQLAMGGTAVGTGINTHPEFGIRVAQLLSQRTGIIFSASPNYFESLSSQDAAAELSGQLKVVAISLMKISNDLRWMNSGPLAGLAEIVLPALQPGSSIMPGKVNPVIPEAVAMVVAQVIGNDTTITVAAQSGNFQLNVMLPVIGYNLLQSIELLSSSCFLLVTKALEGFTVNYDRLKENLLRNPILATSLNTIIGYEQGAEIVKAAYQQRRSLLEVAQEMTELSEEELLRILDPVELTRGGIRSGERSD
jgi:fumarate hydratase class II